MAMSEIAGTSAALDAGAPIVADDASGARILGRRAHLHSRPARRARRVGPLPRANERVGPGRALMKAL